MHICDFSPPKFPSVSEFKPIWNKRYDLLTDIDALFNSFINQINKFYLIEIRKGLPEYPDFLYGWWKVLDERS